MRNEEEVRERLKLNRKRRMNGAMTDPGLKGEAKALKWVLEEDDDD